MGFLLIPSIFDLVGTGLAKIGLMYCTVSVYQLIRCAVIVVVGILKTTILKEVLPNYAWTGIGIVSLGRFVLFSC